MTTKKTQSPEEKIGRAIITLKKIHKNVLKEKLTSVEEMLQAVIVDNGATAEEAKKITFNLRKAYVDWNEVRVARVAELAKIIDPLPDSDGIAVKLHSLLMKIFEKTGRVTLSFIEEMKTNEARRVINNIEPTAKLVVDRILMNELPTAIIPFSNEAISLAIKIKLAPKDSTRQKFNKLLSESVSREMALELFYLIEEHIKIGCTKSKCPLCK